MHWWPELRLGPQVASVFVTVDKSLMKLSGESTMTTRPDSASRIRVIVSRSILAWLLHVANSDPGPFAAKFYDFKKRLLDQFGTFDGHDIQEITKQCWGDKRNEYGDWNGCGPTCKRCGGTGIFDRRWIRLQRWRFGTYLFHIPDGETRSYSGTVQIEGRIQHRDYGKGSREAELWLYLVCLQFRAFWQNLSGSCYATPGWWPLCRLQKLAMPLRQFFRWRRCWCGKRFPTWGTGWQCCKKCRQPRSVEFGEDVPF